MRWPIEPIKSLSGWLCWEDGLHMWLSMRYMIFGLSVNTCLVRVRLCVLEKASQMAYSCAHSMFWNPRSLSTIQNLLIRLFTPKHVVLPTLYHSPGWYKGVVCVHVFMRVVFEWVYNIMF